MGHITADVEMKQVGDQTFARFSLAVDTRAKINGEWGKRTTFWRCTVWGKEAEWLARDANKGALVLVEGEPYSEDYEKDGQKKTSPHHVRCTAAKCLEKRDRDAKPAAAPASAPRIPAAPSGGAGYDEAPFARHGEEVRA
jgi:single stranded DNA-binding protein